MRAALFLTMEEGRFARKNVRNRKIVKFSVDKNLNQAYNISCSVREWRNWQTRMIQVHVL